MNAQLRDDDSGRFASDKPAQRKPPHPCERLARTFNAPPAMAEVMLKIAANSGNKARSRQGSDDGNWDDWDGGTIGKLGKYVSLPESISWRRQFEDAMAVGAAGHATGLPSDLLLARWAGQDHRGLACRLVFARLERMGLSNRRHVARIAVAWVVHQALPPMPRSPNERPPTFRGRLLPVISLHDAARQVRVREETFRLLTRLARAILGDLLRELENAYCSARFSGF